MNIILFEKDEICKPVPLTDERASHIITVLKMGEGDSFDAGIINECSGKGKIEKIDDRQLFFSFTYTAALTERRPAALITAVTRPVEAKKLLQNCATLGIAELHLALLDKSEKSYLESRLWKEENYRSYLVKGASQAFAVDIPELYIYNSLDRCMENISDRFLLRAALDNYEAEMQLGTFISKFKGNQPVILAAGGERGWSGREREILRENRFTICSLGKRVLKTETACISGLSVIFAQYGIF